MIPSTFFPVLAASASALGTPPNLCITEPPLVLVAGESIVQAADHDPDSWDCRAVLHFSNPAFAPITYLYDDEPCSSGSANATFLVPPGVPNGDAFLIWSCGIYTQACVRAIISKGEEDPELPAFVDGNVDCESFWGVDEDAQPTNGLTENDAGTPIIASMPIITETSTSGDAEDGGGPSSQPPNTSTDITATPKVTPTPAASIGSALQAKSSTSTSTDGSEGYATGGVLTVTRSAPGVTTPSLVRSFLTVTQTVTTLVTSTLTAAR